MLTMSHYAGLMRSIPTFNLEMNGSLSPPDHLLKGNALCPPLPINFAPDSEESPPSPMEGVICLTILWKAERELFSLSLYQSPSSDHLHGPQNLVKNGD